MKGDNPPVHACNPHRPGDLILGVHREDKIGAELHHMGLEQGLPGLEEVQEQANLEQVVAALRQAEAEESKSERGDEQTRLEVEGSYEFRLLEVPEGEEHRAATSLIDLHHRLASQYGEEVPAPVIAQPNHFLDHDGAGPPDRLSPDHQRYLREIGVPPGGFARRAGVRVIDSGYTGPARVAVGANLLDSNPDVSDDFGHGSLVASIIDDCAPGEFEIFKVSSLRRRPSEWEVIQALTVGPFPPIVNLSLSLGFGRASCARCGRQSVSARTGTFEARLAELADSGVTVVVAAGNAAAPELAYPSRFRHTVAVEAWSGKPPRPAPYSNLDRSSQRRGSHPNVFLCPGGDSQALEGPGLDAAGNPVDGTSYATAYMSGLLAASWGMHSNCTAGCSICRDELLALAQSVADPNFQSYDREKHGHGLARLQPMAR